MSDGNSKDGKGDAWKRGEVEESDERRRKTEAREGMNSKGSNERQVAAEQEKQRGRGQQGRDSEGEAVWGERVSVREGDATHRSTEPTALGLVGFGERVHR